jgi:hypothetical protein
MENETRENNLLLMPHTISLDDVSLREPTHADVLVPVRCKHETLVGREEKRGEQGGVSEHEVFSCIVFCVCVGVFVCVCGNKSSCSS